MTVVEGVELSPQQRRLWRLGARDGHGAYRSEVRASLHGPLDAETLEEALLRRIAGHELLGCRFAVPSGLRVPLMEAAEAAEPAMLDTWRLETADPSAAVSAEAAEEGLGQLLAQRRRRPFELGGPGPHLRALLVRRSAGEHQLVLEAPALVADAAVLLNLLGELREELAGEAPETREAPLSYLDVTGWLEDAASGEDARDGRDYWRRKAAEGEPDPAPEERLAFARGAGAFQPEALELVLPEAAAVEALATDVFGGSGEHGTAAFHLACWGTLLSRLRAGARPTVGVELEGRDYEELDSVVGPLARTVPHRAGPRPGETFRQLLARVAAELAEDGTWQECFVREAAPGEEEPRDFLALFAWRDLGGRLPAAGRSGTDGSPELRLEGLSAVLEPFTVALAGGAAASAGGSAAPAELLFDAGRCRREDAGRLGRQLAALERDALARPGARAEELDCLAPEERRQVLEELRRPATLDETAAPRTVVELFLDQAARRPAEGALIGESQIGETRAGEGRWTFGELGRRVDHLARQLRRLGVGPEVVVALHGPRTADAVVALLAVLRAGGAYLPLDPANPAERNRELLATAGAGLLLCTGKLPPEAPDLDGGDVPRADLEALGSGEAAGADGRSAGTDLPLPAPESLAYVLFTSGSTGRPKGVAVENRQLAAYVRGILERFAFEGRNLALVSTLAADLGNTVLFGALCGGGCLHVFDQRVVTDPDAFGERMAAGGIDGLKIVPGHLEALLAGAEPRRVLPRRCLFLGGEATTHRLLERIRELAPGCRVVNHYGPTETTVGVLAHQLEGRPEEPGEGLATEEVFGEGGIVPLGSPLSGASVAVLGPGPEPVPAWAVGEIHIGGDTVARGYLGAPRETAARFLPDPFSQRPGTRLYRSGDRMRRFPDGTLAFAGRRDHQVKLRGFRIELGEVEAALRAQPEVREAVAVVREDSPGERRLVAYVVRREDGEGAPAAGPWDARETLRRLLPEAAVPAAVVELPRLPLTANGKVDRKALPIPAAQRRIVAPRNPVEAALARIWSEVLGVEEVSVEDDFFRLGGDSILSIQVVARANRAGLSFTARDLFRHSTLAEIAGRATVEGAPAAAARQLGPVPLTPIQRWFFEGEPAEPHHFNQTLVLLPRRRPTAAELRRALQAVAEAHEAFRLRFRPPGSEGPGELSVWTQELVPEARFDLEEVDLEGVSPEAWPEVFDQHLQRLERSLDLGEGPLFRAAQLLGPPPAGDRLVLVAHHLVVDGVSWRILLDELEAALEGGDGDHGPVPEGSGYKAWAEALAEAAAAGRETEHRAWQDWHAVEAAPLPADFEADPAENTVASMAEVRRTFGRELTRSLLGEALGPYRARIDDLLLTCLAGTLAAAGGGRRVEIELEGHGREEVEGLPGGLQGDGLDLARTIGWFTRRYPARLELPAGEIPAEALKAVKEQLRRASAAAAGYGLARYLAHYRGEEPAGEAVPWRDPQVSYNNFGSFDAVLGPGRPWELAGEGSAHSRSSLGRRRQLLDVVVVVLEGRLEVRWLYSRAFHRASTVEAWSRDFERRLEALAEHCRSPAAGGLTPSDVPLAALDQGTLDRLFPRPREVEDVYPLSPLQHGILVHSVRAEGAGSYISASSCTLRGAFDPAAFRRAWELALKRHPALRTSFLWQQVDEPLQVVHRSLELPWREIDARHLSPAAPEELLEELFTVQRQRGFDLERAPLFELRLVRLGADAYRFFWLRHHLLLDGWSTALLFREILEGYQLLARARSVPQPVQPRAAALPVRPPYCDYIAWLRRQDLGAAERFWRGVLEGFREPTPLPYARRPAAPPAETGGYETRSRELPADRLAALRELARREGLTLNSLGQGFWALLLAHAAGSREVVFGSVGAGRPPELEGSEEMVGMFINSLPVRVRVAPEAGLLPYLRALQEQLAEQRQYEHTPLVAIQSWSEVPHPRPLFESFFVLENYPQLVRSDDLEGVEILEVDQAIRNSYPLTLRVLPEPSLRLDVLHDLSRVSREAAGRILDRMEWCLSNAGELLEGDLRGVLEGLAQEDRQDASRAQEGYESAVVGGLQRMRQQMRRRGTAKVTG